MVAPCTLLNWDSVDLPAGLAEISLGPPHAAFTHSPFTIRQAHPGPVYGGYNSFHIATLSSFRVSLARPAHSPPLLVALPLRSAAETLATKGAQLSYLRLVQFRETTAGLAGARRRALHLHHALRPAPSLASVGRRPSRLGFATARRLPHPRPYRSLPVALAGIPVAPGPRTLPSLPFRAPL